MRALLFTAEEPLYLPRYLEPILAAHAEAFDAVVVADSRKPVLAQVHEQYRMFGPRAFARMSAKFARGRLLDAIGEVGVRVTGRHHSVASVARIHGVPVRRVADVSDPAFLAWADERDPDLLLSIVCGQLLPADVLATADDAVNLHGSLLPNYRGRATAFWPLYYGDDQTGVTAHRMTGRWDAGPIVDQRRVPIDHDETVHSLYLKLADAGAELAVDLLDRYPCKFETRPNPTTADDYHSLPTPAQRRAFRRRGRRFV